jgi:hypothetical protein
VLPDSPAKFFLANEAIKDNDVGSIIFQQLIEERRIWRADLAFYPT